jgi:hypothetical protein
LGARVIVLPPAEGVSVPREPVCRVSPVLLAVALALSVRVVTPVTARMVAPVGMPVPEMTMPGRRPAVLATVTREEALIRLPPVRGTKAPRDSTVGAEAFPRRVSEPPPKVRVAPVRPVTTLPPSRLLVLVAELSRIRLLEAARVLARKPVRPVPR